MRIKGVIFGLVIGGAVLPWAGVQGRIRSTTRENFRDGLAVQVSFAVLEDPKISPAQRHESLDEIGQGVDSLLKLGGEDAATLLRQGQALASQGVDPQTAVLEYWGDSESGREKLKPIAGAAVKIYGRAFDLETAQANNLANKITGPTDQAATEWQKASDAAGAAEYQKVRMQCAAGAGDGCGGAGARALIEEATATLKRWDNGDSGIQPQARFLLAKLKRWRGGSD